MYQVLVPVDMDEQRALAQAEYVASLPDAADSVEAIVLFAFHEEADEELPDDLGSIGRSIERVASVRRVQDHLEERGVAVELVERSGDPADAILAEADDRDVDVIALGGRKRSPAGKAIFGSVTQSVILNTDRPAVVAGRGPE